MNNTTLGNNRNGKGTVTELEPVPSEMVSVDAHTDTRVEPPTEVRTDATPLVDAPAPTTVPPQAPARKRPVKKLLLAGLGVGAVIAGVFGVRWYQYTSTHEQTDNAAVAADIYPISSKVSGSVIAIPVQDNQQVKQGQRLLQIDPRDYQVKVQQAQAALLVAQRQAQAAQQNINLAGSNAQAQSTEAQGSIQQAIAGISAAQAALSEAQAGVPAAQAQLAQAAANLQKAQTDYARYQALFQSGAIARQQLDSSRAAYEVAVAQRNAAQQGVAQAQSRVAQAQQGVSGAQAQLESSRSGLQKAQASNVQTDVNRSNYAAAQAAIAQAQANLAQAQLQLSYTNVAAPAAGRIGRKTVQVGQQVQPGQALMAVVSNEVWVNANFKETQVKRMRPGERVEVEIDAFPGRIFTGRIESLSPASGSEFALLPPDNATGNFTKVVQRIPVKVVLDRDSIRGYEGQITPGMSASAAVEIQ